MNHNCAYVRQHYQVPAEIGRRVIDYGKPGVILADRGHYIGVVLDEDPKKRISNYHPTHEMQYGEMAETLPLKEWLVLPFNHDWDDLDWNREAREDLVRVWAATRSQAKYKAYERLQDYWPDPNSLDALRFHHLVYQFPSLKPRCMTSFIK